MSTSSLAAETHLEGNALLFKTGEYADFVINSGRKRFLVHRSIVCPRSQPIKELIDGKADINGIASVERSTKEAKELATDTTAAEVEVEVKVEDDQHPRVARRTRPDDDSLPIIHLYEDPEYVERILQWIYTGDYNDNLKIVDAHATRSSSSRSVSQPSKALLINARMSILGSQFKLEGLQQLAKQKYLKALNVEGLTDSFTESLKVLYQATFEQDHLIKNTAINFAGIKYPVLIKQANFKTMVQKDGEMAFRVLTAAAERFPAECPSCKSDQDTASRPPMLLKEPRKRIHNHYCFKCNQKFN